jgi:predicted heme/steroid binding protein
MGWRSLVSGGGRKYAFESHINLDVPAFAEPSLTIRVQPLSPPTHSATNLKMGLSFDLGSPINTALLLYILYSIQRILFPTTSTPSELPHEFKSGYSWIPKSHPPTLLYKTYTPKTLEPFHGRDGGRILLAINGIVFDVTAGRSFYGPGESDCQYFVNSDSRVWDRRNVRELCGQRCLPWNGQAVV